MDDFFVILKEFNLTDKELDAYKYLMKVGTNPASVIAKNINVQRPNCYHLLENLLIKGLIVQSIKNGVTYYTVANPLGIIEKVRQKHIEINGQLRSAQLAAFDFLKQEHISSMNNPKAKFFSNTEGIKSLMEDILQENSSEILGYLSADFNDFIKKNLSNYHERRSKMNIFARILVTLDKWGAINLERDNKLKREKRIIPHAFDFGVDTIISHEKVAIISIKENFGILIVSKSIADAQKKLFEYAWNKAKVC